MKETLLGAWLALALVAQIGAHVAIVAGLAQRHPRWRALAALLIPPLAPLWGWNKMPRRARLWALAFAAYAVAMLAVTASQ